MTSVTAPDKRVWKVGRRWLPKRVRLPRRPDVDATDGGLLAIDVAESVSGLVVGLLVAVTLALALVLVWPLFALALELIALVFLALGGVIARVVLRRPWLIVATTEGPPVERLAWDVSGWRASGAAIDEVAAALRSGRDPQLPPHGVSRSVPPGTQRT